MNDIKKQYRPIGKKSSFKLLMYDFIIGLYKERDGKTIWAISALGLIITAIVTILMAIFAPRPYSGYAIIFGSASLFVWIFLLAFFGERSCDCHSMYNPSSKEYWTIGLGGEDEK